MYNLHTVCKSAHVNGVLVLVEELLAHLTPFVSDFRQQLRRVMDFTETYQDTCSTVGMAAREGDLGLIQDLLWRGKE